jgi:hypothetical protein
MKPKLTRGHSVSLRVGTDGRPQLVAVTEALMAMREAGVPLDAEWQMGFHSGKQVTGNGGQPFMEADYISVDATWAEQT